MKTREGECSKKKHANRREEHQTKCIHCNGHRTKFTFLCALYGDRTVCDNSLTIGIACTLQKHCRQLTNDERRSNPHTYTRKIFAVTVVITPFCSGRKRSRGRQAERERLVVASCIVGRAIGRQRRRRQRRRKHHEHAFRIRNCIVFSSLPASTRFSQPAASSGRHTLIIISRTESFDRKFA